MWTKQTSVISNHNYRRALEPFFHSVLENKDSDMHELSPVRIRLQRILWLKIHQGVIRVIVWIATGIGEIGGGVRARSSIGSKKL